MPSKQLQSSSENDNHAIQNYARLDVSAPGYQAPHELARANDIRHRFANREVTTGQIVFFGLTGGLIPCPASITVLILCLQLKKVALGATLVLCFSIGLVVVSGALAALSVRHVSRRWSGFGEFARKAPYLSQRPDPPSGLLCRLSGPARDVLRPQTAYRKASRLRVLPLPAAELD